jgi:endonuclease-3
MKEEERVAKIIELLKKEYPHAKYYLNFSNPIELMVAAILSAQVRDEVVNAATPKLFKKYKSAKDYAKVSEKELANEIKTITFATNKAKNIIAACKILVEKFDGRVPKTIDELTALPGVGRKTANTILSNAYNIISGIPVDVHVQRVSFRLGLTKNKNPDKIEQDLMEIIPKSDWKKFPYILKSHGRALCKALDPFCSKCFLNKLCPKIGVKKKL